ALADLLLEALAEDYPDATSAHREKEVNFAHYLGQLIVLVSSPVADHKIPVWEQELSCGAAGMNLLLGAHALGYVPGWVTGWRAYSERVRRAFCGPGRADRRLRLHRARIARPGGPRATRAPGCRSPLAAASRLTHSRGLLFGRHAVL